VVACAGAVRAFQEVHGPPCRVGKVGRLEHAFGVGFPTNEQKLAEVLPR
jgi:hypothetical protein